MSSKLQLDNSFHCYPLLPLAPSEGQSIPRLKPGFTIFTCGLNFTALSHLTLTDVHFSVSQEPNYPAHELHKRVCFIQDIFLGQVTRKERAGGVTHSHNSVMEKPFLLPAGSRSREEGRRWLKQG